MIKIIINLVENFPNDIKAMITIFIAGITPKLIQNSENIRHFKVYLWKRMENGNRILPSDRWFMISCF